eukprot:scaffold535_cov260-Pinguiococcus_pyrenoidosus.AAC.20
MHTGIPAISDEYRLFSSSGFFRSIFSSATFGLRSALDGRLRSASVRQRMDVPLGAQDENKIPLKPSPWLAERGARAIEQVP